MEWIKSKYKNSDKLVGMFKSLNVAPYVPQAQVMISALAPSSRRADCCICRDTQPGFHGDMGYQIVRIGDVPVRQEEVLQSVFMISVGQAISLRTRFPACRDVCKTACSPNGCPTKIMKMPCSLGSVLSNINRTHPSRTEIHGADKPEVDRAVSATSAGLAQQIVSSTGMIVSPNILDPDITITILICDATGDRFLAHLNTLLHCEFFAGPPFAFGIISCGIPAQTEMIAASATEAVTNPHDRRILILPRRRGQKDNISAAVPDFKIETRNPVSRKRFITLRPVVASLATGNGSHKYAVVAYLDLGFLVDLQPDFASSLSERHVIAVHSSGSEAGIGQNRYDRHHEQ